MRKLYKRSETGEIVEYYEAWHDDSLGVIVQHFGTLGTKGAVLRHSLESGKTGTDGINRVLRGPQAEGFGEVSDDEVAWLIVEYSIDGFGTADDLKMRHNLEDKLDEILGWTGLGHCDGGSIGSATMKAACPVVNFEIAQQVVAKALADGPFSGYTRIYREGRD